MSIAEKLGQGFGVFVIGILVVFLVLIILMGVLTLFRIIFYDIPEKKKLKAKETIVKPVEKTQAPVEIVYEDDTEIVAVITAAIASMLNKSESQFKIKSIRRINKWNKV